MERNLSLQRTKMWVVATIMCTQALLSLAALTITTWIPTVLVSDYDASASDPKGKCRQVLVRQRLSNKIKGLEYDHGLYDKCARQHADQLLLQAHSTRFSKENIRVDAREHGIKPLERLYRVALLAIQPQTTESVGKWVSRWESWWYAKHPRAPYDIRSDEDRFFAYVVERQLGLIRITPEIIKFEADFDAEFTSFAGYRPYQFTQPVPNSLLN